jgi:hypothetical protein
MEKLAKREMSEALAAVNSLRNRQSLVLENIEACEAELSSAPGLGAALAMGLAEVNRKLVTEINSAEGLADEARAAYQRRRRDALSLRRLKEAKLAAWKTEVMKEEQADLEEVSRLRFVRRREAEAIR